MTLEIFEALSKKAHLNRKQSANERIQILQNLRNWHIQNEDRITDALKKDFNKQEFETLATEIFTVRSEIKHVIQNLSKWMRPQKHKTPLALFGHRSWVQFENKGVVLIISPWNYPWLLTLGPLVSALAAGNTVVLKPSELTPHTSQLILEMTQECFSENQVRTFLGGKDISQKLLNLNFHHVFFTGSTAVGKIVAASCAPRLIPFTLELGGRSPVVVDQTCDLKMTVEKIFWGKIMNRSQTCVAPNHVFIHSSIYKQFIEHYKQLEFLLKSNSHESAWTKIVSENHLMRLQHLSGERWNSQQPTQLIELDSFENFITHPSSKEEIFGPILPVIPYQTEHELLSYLTFDDRPLTFAVFSQDRHLIERLRTHYPSGSMTINTTTVQVGNNHLPFGGIGNSGQGRSHGYFGFCEFSHQRSFIKQNFLFSMQKLLMPPYQIFQLKMIRFLIRFLT